MIAPEKITFYCRKKDEDGIYHAFPIDISAKHDTAKSWATVTDREYDEAQRKIIYTETHDPIVFEFENKSFDNIAIVDLYYRGNGGRAYQIILETEGNKFRMDLRERTLMNVIEYKGINAGGRLNGTFCFVKESAQTNIILEGTDEHKSAIEEREKRNKFTKNIRRNDLKVGYMYKTLNDSGAIYLGSVYCCDIDEEEGLVSKPYKAMLFAEDYDRVVEYLKTGKVNAEDVKYGNLRSWHFKISKSHSFKIEGEQVLSKVNFDDTVSNLNELGQKEFDVSFSEGRKSWFEDYSRPYKLANMKIDKKDLCFDEKLTLEMARKYQNRYSRGW